MQALTTRFLACALGTLLSCSALAASHQPAISDQPTRQQVRAYVQRNVLPTLRQQRQKLEARLTSSDKAQLAVYRAQLQELRQRGQALRQNSAPTSSQSAAAPAAALTADQQGQLQQLRTETRALLQEVDKLARPYETDIARLAQEVKPQKEQWTADIRAITASHASGSRPKRQRSRVAQFFRPASFLLLEPQSVPTTAAAPATSQVYPNPAVGISQLTYDVTKAGAVTVELLDGRGNTLRTIAQEGKQEKGPHTVALDVADLPSGTYFFKINTPTGAETRRFVKE
ncbi:T9SS type A sorting domain-containing protein [Hymenobacter pini]|uniref:T9SS type A sorting domain-containing protein n=1 Tax=Hymenobacter pini TaxID=2880879 RepID=UPI001CF434B5|nr:T9SS type A sorting domain-containing protein [Hymenobacter pini]MCA8829159.1 T9SS type A sorting domain-containing protein [Hymenobacter pini]